MVVPVWSPGAGLNMTSGWRPVTRKVEMDSVAEERNKPGGKVMGCWRNRVVMVLACFWSQLMVSNSMLGELIWRTDGWTLGM